MPIKTDPIWAETMARMEGLETENERLRAMIKSLTATDHIMADAIAQRNAENERLREALEAIANYCDHCHETARKALDTK